MNSIFKKVLVLCAIFVLVFSLSSCGGSDSADDGNDVDNTVTATNNQNATAVSRGLTTSLQSSSGGAADLSESAAAMIKAAIKNKIAYKTSGTITDSYLDNCPEGGTLETDISFDYDVDDVTLEIELSGTVSSQFDNCVEADEFTTEDDVLCSYLTTLDGEFDCTLSGSASEDTGIYFEFSCNTASACSGMTAIVDGTTYTVGLEDVGAIMTDTDDEPTYTGTFCIDGTEIDFGDIGSLEDYTSDELVCE